MEVESLRRQVSKLQTEKTSLQVKSKLFENFAAMAHSCCRLPSTAEWQSLKDTLQKTLEFSTELTGAESGNLVLLDSNGVVTDSIRRSCDTGPDQCCELIGQVLDKGIGGWVRVHKRSGRSLR